ncbi:alpha/beta hydrolase [Nocardia sp. alder85J]|uniref:alpha/beta hydrolase n=1 Tax=Nocardia sp. alder85J TaxID=2862949 RepID=UPI001CD20CC1|nr:alpha/beta fold hydrolase [Nocardia sp. alder85J]MCX4095630.1 alpha/beta fold hydrolase [Nocardia sp. alder85J]
MTTTDDRTTTARHDIEIPISVLGEQHRIAATLLRPTSTDGDRPLGLLVAVPGGSYDRYYWDLHVPGLENYSFADCAVQSGWAVLMLDNLGTGASGRPAEATAVTLEVMADAVAQAARFVAAGVRESLIGSGPAQPDLRVVGIGHSLGGHIVAAAQSAQAPFERVALLGSSFLGLAGSDLVSRDRAAAALAPMAGDTWECGYVLVSREAMRSRYHADDVPEEVLRADGLNITRIPREAGIDVMMPQTIGPIAAAVEVPVFLAFADSDTSPDPRAEAANFTNSRDVTYFQLPRSAHCHNSASTRHQLWQRVLEWAGSASSS